jgi:hypothetical protein
LVNLGFTDTEAVRSPQYGLFVTSTGFSNNGRLVSLIRAVAGQPITYTLQGNVDSTAVYDFFMTVVQLSN